MWHPVKFVATERGLIPSELEGFAIVNFNKYGIATENGFCEVNTWFVDSLVDDYKSTLSERLQ